MISKRIPDVRGEVLQKAREAKGISVSELATKVCFSIKQIEQLENGEKSHFYSLAIKANAAKRVADELGISHEDVFDFGPDLVEAAKAPQESVIATAKPSPRPEAKLNATEVADKKESQKKESQQKPAAVKKNTEQKVEQLERFDEAPPPAIQKNRSLYYFGAAAVVAAIGIVILNLNQPQPIKPSEIAKQPSETIAVEPKKEEAATPSPTAIASAPQLSTSQAMDSCPSEDAGTKSYRMASASKPGNMVYVQSRSAQTVCVKDASGKLEKKSLEAGGSYSFYGKAPFVVMTSSLGQTDLFFQGYKVKIDNPNSKSIVLEEVAF
ncbi:helix-turn-helix domain-containing protein [Polynucleobacter acidiphobus]|uniref:helix-turn-helix domain-containing protein n=1 Tax=Polynucleobacter acidiphobus TaxID=556053 RepID=UPI00131EED6A|nr:helix-turn-helix domain-containing protein [Polynucleobacter acidiphobus]